MTIDNIFLEYAANTLAATQSPLTGIVIARLMNAYAIDFNASIPDKVNIALEPNKRSLLFDYLKCFDTEQQYYIINQLCENECFINYEKKEDILILKNRLRERLTSNKITNQKRTEMYYHVLVETNEKKGSKYVELICKDMANLNTIICDICKPFISGQEFMIDGYFLTKKEVHRLKVCCSQEKLEKYVKYEYDALPPNIIMTITDKNIIENDKYTKDITKEVLEQSRELKNKGNEMNRAPVKGGFSKRVFIVHGHEELMRSKVELLIKNLGYEPVVLFKQPNMGNSIIEKIEREAKNIAYAIVLYSACDLATEKERVNKELKPRARQNVVFEHGFMCASLSRSKVCALIEEGVEIPGDLDGVVYVKYDNKDAWQLSVAKEMMAAGLDVDLKGLLR